MKGLDGRDCIAIIEHPVIKLSGSQSSTLYFSNPEKRRIERIEVDDCAITTGLRCDWLLRTDDTVSIEDIFVELKGSDIKHAVEQLEVTVRQLARNVKSTARRCYVVHTRCPMSGTDITNYKVRFQKLFNARFQTVGNGRTIPL